MSTYTLFLSPEVVAYPTDTPDPFYAKWLDQFNPSIRNNISQTYAYSVAVDSAQTVSVPVPTQFGSLWCFVAMRVVGEAYLTIKSGAGADTGYLNAYGVAEWPGYAMATFSQITATPITVTGSANGTTVEVFIGLVAEDA